MAEEKVEKITLQDSETGENLVVAIKISKQGIEISPAGYGVKECDDSGPIWIEFHNRVLQVCVWNDINVADCEIITLENAKEGNRQEE